MSKNEDLRAAAEAARAVARRPGGVSEYERAMQRYLSAMDFENRPGKTPEGWAGKPEHPAPRTNEEGHS